MSPSPFELIKAKGLWDMLGDHCGKFLLFAGESVLSGILFIAFLSLQRDIKFSPV